MAQVEQMIRTHVPEDFREKLMSLILSVTSQLERDARIDAQNDIEGRGDAVVVEQVPSPPSVRATRGGKVHMDEERALFKNASNPKEKLDSAIAIFSLYNTLGSGKVTSSVRTFVGKIIIPMINCLNNHFTGDSDLFLLKHGEDVVKRATKFTSICCLGGDTCSTKKVEKEVTV